ncbi:hypothetical protein EW146_g4859 [Bondarzewia mesenterica]|uniref:Uncharacterized protein n=1 Tax=Bondarzewia mesenterica TaxID=1095465 RepID=A0A4S4LT99_9AGAM|nr:hypothetical protein EW146_g4859 [Bondarzewia mesenterica]
MSNLPNGIVCTAEEYAQSKATGDDPYPTLTCLTRLDTVGVTLTVEAGAISLAAILLVFILISRNVYRHWTRVPWDKWRLLAEPMDIFMLSLLCSDVLQAVGAFLNFKWVTEGKVYSGPYCTAQGAIQQLGETGVAMATFVISVHTFIAVMWRRGTHSRLAAFIVVGFIWLYVILFVGLGVGLHKSKDDMYDTPTPYWCWIGGQFKAERIAGEYFWLWLALFTSVIVYVPLYFWSQGRLTVDPSCWWRFRWHRPVDLQDSDGRKRRAMAMLAYPLIYSVLVLPLTIVRWINFGLEAHGAEVPSALSFVVIILFGLSGFANVFLLLATRPRLLLFSKPDVVVDAEGRAPSPSSLRPVPLKSSFGDVSSQAPMQLGRLNDDMGWNLPSGRMSVASSYVSTEDTK